MRWSLFFVLVFATGPAVAQNGTDRFTDGADGAKIHVSGFVCPSQIGVFERDAVGEQDAESHADFRAYSALDGVYGTITLRPVAGGYDAKAMLAAQFLEQEATGGKQVREGALQIGERSLYTRSYETTSLEDLRYRIIFAGGAVSGYALEATVEFATPRDDAFERDFLNAVYNAGAAKIAALPASAKK